MTTPKRLVLVAATGAALVLAAAPPALALHEDDTKAELDCAFTALAGTANPGVASVLNDGVGLVDTDDGEFDLDGDLTCGGLDTAGADKWVLPPMPDNLHLHGDGHFDNLVCGTLRAHGTATLTDNGPSAVSTGSPLDVGIDLTWGLDQLGGVSILTLTLENGQDGRIEAKPGGAGIPDNMVHSGAGEGVVTAVPLGNMCAATDETDWSLSGAFRLALAGDASDDIDP